MILEKIRKNRGLSYEEFAKELDLPPTTVFRVCKKQGCIRLTTAHQIIKKLGGLVTYSDFLDEAR